MASYNYAKRELYQPAENGAVSKDPKSKALDQGILTDSTASWQEELSRSTSDFYSKEVISTTHDKGVRWISHNTGSTGKAKEMLSSKHHMTGEEKLQESLVADDLDMLQKPDLYRKEVLVVDASGPVLHPDSSEVSTTTHKVFSPVKAIRHSPLPDRQKQSHETNTVTGNYDGKVSPKHIVLENEEDSTRNDTNENSEREENSAEKSSTLDSMQRDKKMKTKKKAPKIIQSRYMEPKVKPDKDGSKAKQATHSFIHNISAIPSHSIIEGTTKSQGMKKKKAKVTSTPFNPQTWIEKTRSVADGSYLDISKNLVPTQSDEKHRVSRASKERKEKPALNKGKQATGDSGISIGMNEQRESVTEARLMVEYARMLQAMFLDLKAKDTFSKQEKEAKQQMYNVWQENQKLKSEIRQLEQAHMMKKHAMALDQLLKVQDSGLKSVDESLDKLENNYLSMGEALDTTRHYMPVEDVIIGDENKLIAALKENQMILAELSSHTGTRAPGIEHLATNFSSIVSQSIAEIAEQNRCQELLIAANSKTSHERSLQAQILLSKLTSSGQN